MFNGGSAPSLADIAAVVDNNGGNNGGFGSGEGWWVLIILFALFGGWGNGYGNGGGTNAVNGDIQRGFDTQAIITKLDGINAGICSLGYDQLAQMNNIGMTIMQQGNALGTQISDCCCKYQTGQMQIMNQMGQSTCQITNAIKDASRDIMDNANANYRQLHDEQVALQMQQYKEKIQEQANLINALNLSASQKNQTQEIKESILSELRKCPIGTYDVPNPNCCYGPWGAGNWGNFLLGRQNNDCNTCGNNGYAFA